MSGLVDLNFAGMKFNIDNGVGDIVDEERNYIEQTCIMNKENYEKYMSILDSSSIHSGHLTTNLGLVYSFRGFIKEAKKDNKNLVIVKIICEIRRK